MLLTRVFLQTAHLLCERRQNAINVFYILPHALCRWKDLGSSCCHINTIYLSCLWQVDFHSHTALAHTDPWFKRCLISHLAQSESLWKQHNYLCVCTCEFVPALETKNCSYCGGLVLFENRWRWRCVSKVMTGDSVMTRFRSTPWKLSVCVTKRRKCYEIMCMKRKAWILQDISEKTLFTYLKAFPVF